MNWRDGKPTSNDYVCSNHFNVKDIAFLGDNTTIVPTQFNPEFVAIKEEYEIFDPNSITQGSDVLVDVDHDKTENDGHNEIADYNFLTYESIESPTILDDKFKILTPKRIKLEDNSLNIKMDRMPTELSLATTHADDNVSKSPENHSKHTTCSPKTETQIKRIGRQWEDNETREFLLCVSKHREEFIRARIHKFKIIEVYLKQLDVLSQPPTAVELKNRWNGLMRRYKAFSISSNKLELNDLPFNEEIKEILLDSLESDRHSISVGLDSSFQAVKQNKTKARYTDDTLDLNKTRDVLLKKIEDREIKNNKLRTLLNDSYCNLIPSGFNLVKIDQPNKLLLKRKDVQAKKVTKT